MTADPIAAVADLFTAAVSRIWPDATEQQKAQLSAELEATKIQMSAIMAEAQSADGWTSRARPSFLYVVYILLLWSLPMSIVYAISPETASHITDGFKQWLSAIPASITDLFNNVMLGYIGARTLDKGVPEVRKIFKR